MKLHHIWILVDNYEQIKQEYIDNFGYSLVKEMTKDGSIFCFLAQGNQLPYLEIIKLKSNSLNLPTMHLAYQVESIQEKFDQLIKSWYIQIKKPSPASMITENAFLCSPDGTTCIELMLV